MHQRKLVWPVVVPLACCLSGSPAPGGPQSTTYDCVANEPDERIAGCTQIINSGRARPRDRATAFYRRGQAYFQKEAYDRAIADFTSAIRLDPKDARVFNARGLAYREKDNPDAAIADFTSAIRLDPKNVRVYNHRGVAHGDKADFDRAIADYSAAIRLDPKYSIAYFNRAKEYRDYGQLERAIADLT